MNILDRPVQYDESLTNNRDDQYLYTPSNCQPEYLALTEMYDDVATTNDDICTVQTNGSGYYERSAAVDLTEIQSPQTVKLYAMEGIPTESQQSNIDMQQHISHLNVSTPNRNHRELADTDLPSTLCVKNVVSNDDPRCNNDGNYYREQHYLEEVYDSNRDLDDVASTMSYTHSIAVSSLSDYFNLNVTLYNNDGDDDDDDDENDNDDYEKGIDVHDHGDEKKNVVELGMNFEKSMKQSDGIKRNNNIFAFLATTWSHTGSNETDNDASETKDELVKRSKNGAVGLALRRRIIFTIVLTALLIVAIAATTYSVIHGMRASHSDTTQQQSSVENGINSNDNTIMTNTPSKKEDTPDSSMDDPSNNTSRPTVLPSSNASHSYSPTIAPTMSISDFPTRLGANVTDFTISEFPSIGPTLLPTSTPPATRSPTRIFTAAPNNDENDDEDDQNTPPTDYDEQNVTSPSGVVDDVPISSPVNLNLPEPVQPPRSAPVPVPTWRLPPQPVIAPVRNVPLNPSPSVNRPVTIRPNRQPTQRPEVAPVEETESPTTFQPTMQPTSPSTTLEPTIDIQPEPQPTTEIPTIEEELQPAAEQFDTDNLDD